MKTATTAVFACVLGIGPARAAAPASAPAPAGRQVGSVEIPDMARLSAAIYDADGALIRTLYSFSPQPKGNVALKWDGRDHHGRLVARTGAYTWKAVISRVEAVEQSGIGDSQFTPLGDGNAFES